MKSANLARSVLDNDVTVLTDGAGLLRVSLRSSGVSLGFKVMLLVRHDCFFPRASKGKEENLLIGRERKGESKREKEREQRPPIGVRVRFYSGGGASEEILGFFQK